MGATWRGKPPSRGRRGGGKGEAGTVDVSHWLVPHSVAPSNLVPQFLVHSFPLLQVCGGVGVMVFLPSPLCGAPSVGSLVRVVLLARMLLLP